jgi:hypothetical protein
VLSRLSLAAKHLLNFTMLDCHVRATTHCLPIARAQANRVAEHALLTVRRAQDALENELMRTRCFSFRVKAARTNP